MLKYKSFNLNVTEVLVSDFKNAFPGIFNFTVGVLIGAKNNERVSRDSRESVVKYILNLNLFLIKMRILSSLLVSFAAANPLFDPELFNSEHFELGQGSPGCQSTAIRE